MIRPRAPLASLALRQCREAVGCRKRISLHNSASPSNVPHVELGATACPTRKCSRVRMSWPLRHTLTSPYPAVRKRFRPNQTQLAARVGAVRRAGEDLVRAELGSIGSYCATRERAALQRLAPDRFRRREPGHGGRAQAPRDALAVRRAPRQAEARGGRDPALQPRVSLIAQFCVGRESLPATFSESAPGASLLRTSSAQP